jgi:branched-chain amino acid transport system permease protein
MQIFINGIIQGLLIALMAMGFSIVYNSIGILHIAQGAVFAISPFLLLTLINSGIGVAASIAITLAGVVLISLLFELLNHSPLYKKEALVEIHFISSLGIRRKTLC